MMASTLDVESENVGLTTGKAVPRRNWLIAVLVCVVACITAVIGVVVGVVVARLNLVNTDGLVAMVPFLSLPDASLNFLVIGDWGVDGKFNQTQTAQSMGVVAANLNADFFISTGDNFYPDGLINSTDPQFKTSFTDIYTAPSLNRLWYAVLGEHDYMGNPNVELDPALRNRDVRWHCEKNYRRRFNACPKTQKSYCYYTMEVFFIDTTPLITEYWDQSNHNYADCNFTGMADNVTATNNVVNILRDGLDSSDATWKIVVGHHSIFSTGQEGTQFDLHPHINPLLQEYNVDIYFNGHNHNLELHRLPFQAANMFFVTSGAGSQVGFRRNGPIPGVTEFYHAGQGFVAVSVLEKNLNLQFYDVYGKPIYNATLAK